MVEINESGTDEIVRLKEIAGQVKYGHYSTSAQKMTVKDGDEIVGFIQYRPVVFIENIFIDQKINLIRRTFLMVKIVKILAKLSMSFIWTSYRYADRKHTKKNELLEKLYYTFGRKFDMRHKDMWYRF